MSEDGFEFKNRMTDEEELAFGGEGALYVPDRSVSAERVGFFLENNRGFILQSPDARLFVTKTAGEWELGLRIFDPHMFLNRIRVPSLKVLMPNNPGEDALLVDWEEGGRVYIRLKGWSSMEACL